MTGFGTGSARAGELSATVEIRSVNHRYLKVSTSQSGTEIERGSRRIVHELEEQLRKHVERGALQVQLQIERVRADDAGVVDHERLGEIASELEKFRGGRAHPEAYSIGLDGLLGLEGVLRRDEPVSVDEATRCATEALERALETLDEAKCREGEHLRNEMNDIVGRIEKTLDGLNERVDALNDESVDRYRKRLESFLAETGVELDDTLIAHEVAMLAEKADATEEFGRLRGHFEQFRSVLAGGARVGRKLDFLAQEMFREVNTLSAKWSRYEVATEVVDMKAEIDRLREQVQNIE